MPTLDLALAEAEYQQRKAAEARLAQQQAEARRALETQRSAAGHSISVPNREQRQKELAQNSRNRFKLKTSTTAASANSGTNNTTTNSNSNNNHNGDHNQQQPPPPPYIGGQSGQSDPRDTSSILEEVNSSFQPTIVAIGGQKHRPSSSAGAATGGSDHQVKRPRPN